jgi:hypothetical protein
MAKFIDFAIKPGVEDSFSTARPLSFSVTAIQIQCVLCNIAAAIAAP